MPQAEPSTSTPKPPFGPIETRAPSHAAIEAARTLSEIARFVELVDREQGTLVGITFFESEEDMRRADEALNSMSPGEGGGQRTRVEIFEVAIDTNLALTS